MSYIKIKDEKELPPLKPKHSVDKTVERHELGFLERILLKHSFIKEIKPLMKMYERTYVLIKRHDDIVRFEAFFYQDLPTKMDFDESSFGYRQAQHLNKTNNSYS
jgi:hypothetical protein